MGSLRNRVVPRPKRRLEVTVKAMDLRKLSQPIMVGQYEQDPIAGPQALIDRDLLSGDLTVRYNLGVYAGPLGTALVVLPGLSAGRPSLSGAIVTGLGKYDGSLSPAHLTDAVRDGTLRRSQGLFAGVSLEGTVIGTRNEANAAHYGRPVTAGEILSGKVAPPPGAKRLLQVLAKH